MPGFAEHPRGSCGALAAAGSSESSFALQQAVDLVLQNGLGLSSLEGNPADSSTNITVPPPVTPTPTPGTPTPTPATPTPTPSPVSPSLEITQALGRRCDFQAVKPLQKRLK